MTPSIGPLLGGFFVAQATVRHRVYLPGKSLPPAQAFSAVSLEIRFHSQHLLLHHPIYNQYFDMCLIIVLTGHLTYLYTPFVTQDQMATYRNALKEARTSFDRASQRLNEIQIEEHQLNDEISRLRRTITALAAMCSESPGMDKLGITDACMEVMEESSSMTLTTSDVVGALEARGFDLNSQKNASASVHAVLTRLASKGKITRITDSTNTVAWRGPNYKESGITDEDIPF